MDDANNLLKCYSGKCSELWSAFFLLKANYSIARTVVKGSNYLSRN